MTKCIKKCMYYCSTYQPIQPRWNSRLVFFPQTYLGGDFSSRFPSWVPWPNQEPTIVLFHPGPYFQNQNVIDAQSGVGWLDLSAHKNLNGFGQAWVSVFHMSASPGFTWETKCSIKLISLCLSISFLFLFLSFPPSLFLSSLPIAYSFSFPFSHLLSLHSLSLHAFSYLCSSHILFSVIQGVPLDELLPQMWRRNTCWDHVSQSSAFGTKWLLAFRIKNPEMDTKWLILPYPPSSKNNTPKGQAPIYRCSLCST